VATNPLHDQIAKIEENIATFKATIKKARHNQRIHFLGIVAILCVAIVVPYWAWFHINGNDLGSPDPSRSIGPFFLVSFIGIGCFAGLGWIIYAAQVIISDTVDNLKVAQFIYLLLDNQEIRDVLQTVSQKANASPLLIALGLHGQHLAAQSSLIF